MCVKYVLKLVLGKESAYKFSFFYISKNTKTGPDGLLFYIPDQGSEDHF